LAAGIEFDWDRANIDHLAEHKVMPGEFEQLLNNNPVDLDFQMVDGEDRYRSIGLTDRGRLLTAVWTIRDGKIRAITAFPAGPAARKLFLEKVPMKKQPKRVIPSFSTEAEEAAWWSRKRKTHDAQTVAAVSAGQTQILTQEKLLARIAASRKAPAKAVALRIPESDLALARKQAEEKGLPYQTYIKSLLHETLISREKRKAG
jgi:predicted DNA binding CopG/RHH family protein/uncharacterized DUF497 family protein